jgi:hypothetical protein
MLMDGKFVPLRHALASSGIVLNTTLANEHLPKIKRQIRVIMERVRATRHQLPFEVIPLLMMIDLIYYTVLWINAFPPKGGVLEHLSPQSIMTGINFDYQKHCQIQFGWYAQVHEEPSQTSSMSAHTVGAICLGPTGNIQGSYKFLNLRTGRRITCCRFTMLPMPQEVITRVNQLGKADGQPELLTFYDRKGLLIGETPGVSDPDTFDAANPQDDDGYNDISPPTANQSYGLEDEPPENQEGYQVDHENDPLLSPDTSIEPENISQTPDEIPVDDTDGPPESQFDSDPDYQQPPDDIQSEVPHEGATIPRRSPRTRLQPQQLVPSFGGKLYETTSGVTTHLIHPEAHMDPDYTLVAHIIMVQYSMKAGMRHFKQRRLQGTFPVASS